MKRKLALFLTGLATVFPFAAAADRKSDAYDACITIIAEHLPAERREAIKFAEVGPEIDGSQGLEFYFAFKSGTIQNATRALPDKLTGSMEPSASCGGTLAPRQIEWVTVNGTDVIDAPVRY